MLCASQSLKYLLTYFGLVMRLSGERMLSRAPANLIIEGCSEGGHYDTRKLIAGYKELA